jgi:hypothetical protein
VKAPSTDGINTDLFTAKQCYHCQGLGHVQADCPTLRLNGGATGSRCYTCGQIGHLARNCPNPNSQPNTRGGGAPRGGYGGGFRGGMVSNNRAATCYKCGGPNHYARDCQAQAMKCYACGKLVRLRFCSLKSVLTDDVRVIYPETAPRQMVALSTLLAKFATSAAKPAIFLAIAPLRKRTASQQLRQPQPWLRRQQRTPTRHHPFQQLLQLLRWPNNRFSYQTTFFMSISTSLM